MAGTATSTRGGSLTTLDPWIGIIGLIARSRHTTGSDCQYDGGVWHEGKDSYAPTAPAHG